MPSDPTSSTLPRRPGPRPRATRSNPHTQLEQIAPTPLQEELWRRLSSLPGVGAGGSLISLPDTRAAHLVRDARGPGQAFLIGHEFAHLHPAGDGSLHAALPPGLAAEAIESGWAEHHPMVGTGQLPPSYVMLYGPRDADELETVWGLVLASYAYARGQERPAA